MRNVLPLPGALAFSALFVFLLGSTAEAAMLTFDAGSACGAITCVNNSLISQDYGDTPDVDVSYDRDISTAIPDDMSWWDLTYSDLQGVAWGGFSDLSGRAAISFHALTSDGITVGGFDFGSYLPQGETTQFSIIDLLDDSVLFSSATITVSEIDHTSISDTWSSTLEIQIQFGPSAYNVGIDNIEYSVGTAPEPNLSAVPIPGSLPLIAGGLGALGLLRRRKNAAA